MTVQLSRPATYAKALVAAGVAGLGVLTAAAQKDGVSLVEWLTAASATLVAGGAVFGVGNAR